MRIHFDITIIKECIDQEALVVLIVVLTMSQTMIKAFRSDKVLQKECKVMSKHS